MRGSGAGFFGTFNRNKKSIAVYVKDPRGVEIVYKLLAGADVFSENVKSGTMDKLGLGYVALSRVNPRLVYVSHKGFLPGPYDHRTALDEVVQMMGGLAYMTGPEGRPPRAGTSVNDILGGMFGAIGAMAALAQRERSGCGQEAQSALFENNVFLVAQHMMQFAVTGQAAAPMPNRISAWAVYDVFSVKNGEQIFLVVGLRYPMGTVLRRFRARRGDFAARCQRRRAAHRDEDGAAALDARRRALATARGTALTGSGHASASDGSRIHAGGCEAIDRVRCRQVCAQPAWRCVEAFGERSRQRLKQPRNTKDTWNHRAAEAGEASARPETRHDIHLIKHRNGRRVRVHS
ncbi:CaiB/BaiF CoA-transferase family protein [Paraburkholderia sp. JHI869]|uniref:CaiB/BaiF CoA-transferase family protein n=1 Tax=Paraburkholderia sp. JHI869 TaxID=3112959 RepID=UPI003170CF80